ncbi:putative cyclic nucleotide-gated ion channel 20, chloroplastic [Apostasia shenzhenica]|uniref:Putative cyclic nucleotide-gated ion channel 20, chloroplastic n=1 Tax=Apostasia shenzhenica TaxID=1088818 RepID=A0A2I0A215_9ASPA|nr:putative cyclic nucleotide-gated ion channel 20, chloroplastic [Apostasia shenzhenica]
MTGSYEDHNSMEQGDVELRRLSARSISMSTPFNASYESEAAFMSHTGPLRSQRPAEFSPMSGPLCRNPTPGNACFHKVGRQNNKSHAIMPEEMERKYWFGSRGVQRNEHLWKSGPLGVCNNPDCIDCPVAYKTNRVHYKSSGLFETKLHNILYGDAEGWARRPIVFLNSYFPIMNPHTKVVQQWNKFFVISCLVAIFVDPLFFFLLSARQSIDVHLEHEKSMLNCISLWSIGFLDSAIKKEHKCLDFNWSLATGIAVVRSFTDFIYFLHMLLQTFAQFRLAYVAPESRVVGAGDLVDDPKKIAMHYLRGYFLLDLFVVLPLPQVMILVVIPKYIGASSANYAKNLLRATVLLQYGPRIIRFLPLLAGQSASGFIFESAWANFVINLLMFVLAGHVAGSCWYLFGLQRVNQCLKEACFHSQVPSCQSFIDCGRGIFKRGSDSQAGWSDWTQNSNATNCFSKDGDFNYGIYGQAVNLAAKDSVVTRYVYSLFWGFQVLILVLF